jgi:hypothetical protein
MAAPLYPQPVTNAVAPVAQPAAAQQPKAPTIPDPFGGQGVWTGTGWLPASHPGAQQAQGAQQPAAAGAPATTKVPQGPGNTYNTPGVQGGPTIQTQFRDSLLKQLQTDPTNVSLTDPDIAPQIRANQNAGQRSQERAQQELAEQGFVGGTGRTGAYGAELNAMEQQRGEAEGQFNAGVLRDTQAQRLESLFNALGLGQGQIQGDEGLKQQINAGNQQNALGQGDLALRKQLGQGQLGLGLLNAMLGDRQANNSLGLNAAEFGAGLNQNAVLKMLGLG